MKKATIGNVMKILLRSSYIHSSLVEEGDISSNDEITYSGNKNSRIYVKTFSQSMELRLKKLMVNFSGKVTGTVVQIYNKRSDNQPRKITAQKAVYCNQKIVKKVKEKVGDSLFKLNQTC